MHFHPRHALRRIVLITLATALTTLVIVTVDYVLELRRDDLPVAPGTEASIGGPLDLVNADGTPVTERSFGDRHRLMFFGFTHCPHVCPSTLARLSEVLRVLGNGADALAVVFITVDPQRDTPAHLRSYRAPFDPRIHYLTGTDAQIAAAAAAYGVSFSKVALPDGDYTMDHTAALYLMAPDNRLVESFADSATAPQIATAVKAHTGG